MDSEKQKQARETLTETQKQLSELMKKQINGATIEVLWELLADAGEDNLQMKLYKETDDQDPFRAIVFIHGKKAAREILGFIDGRGKT